MFYTLTLASFLAVPVGDVCVSANAGTYVVHTDEPLDGVPSELDHDGLSPIGDPLGDLLKAVAVGEAWTDDGPAFEVHKPGRAAPGMAPPEPCKGISTSPFGVSINNPDTEI